MVLLIIVPMVQISTQNCSVIRFVYLMTNVSFRGKYEITHTITEGPSAWLILKLKNKALIKEIRIYNRMNCCQHRIDGVTLWIGDDLNGGYYEGAIKVGTVQYVRGKTPYIFSGIDKTGSSVELQGSQAVLSVAEVEVYGKI